MKRPHRRRVGDDQDQELLRLKKEWGRLTLVERGDRLALLLQRGWSRRSLARRLKCSEGSIRRNVRIARLPVPVRAEIAAGKSAEVVLASESELLVEVQRQQRLVRERESEQISNGIAAILVRWVEFIHSAPAFVPQLFHEIQMKLDSAEYWSRVDPAQVRMPKPLHEGATVWTMIRRCEPTPQQADFELARLALWGARWLARVAPGSDCRTRALKKALRTIEKK